jgi:hypothetical protein
MPVALPPLPLPALCHLHLQRGRPRHRHRLCEPHWCQTGVVLLLCYVGRLVLVLASVLVSIKQEWEEGRGEREEGLCLRLCSRSASAQSRLDKTGLLDSGGGLSGCVS